MNYQLKRKLDVENAKEKVYNMLKKMIITLNIPAKGYRLNKSNEQS
jgi:hypothetical protein